MAHSNLARIMALVALVSLAGLVPQSARACGNYTHLWAATDALNYLDDGDLKDILARPGALNALKNGANFPDGGYAVHDAYGETSHWDPMHQAYLQWIMQTYQKPYSDEAALHIAFLMGMAAHGMSDQLYDGMYLERHEVYDPQPTSEPMVGLDGATDACFAAKMGPIGLPTTWVPADVVAPFYPALDGHTVAPKTIENGQSLVLIAVMAANDAAANPTKIAEYTATYPWACEHQDDATVPGSPPTHGKVIARYWLVLWGRLQGDSPASQPLLGSFYSVTDQPYAQTLDSADPASWVSFVMPFGLAPSTINADSVVVTSVDGTVPPVAVNVYYGVNSHLVNIMPQQNWSPDTNYTVTVSAPAGSWDNIVLEGSRSFDFTTRLTPEDPAEPALEPSPEAEADVVGAPDATEVTTDATADTAGTDGSGGSGGCTAGGNPDDQAGRCALLLGLALMLLGLQRRSKLRDDVGLRSL